MQHPPATKLDKRNKTTSKKLGNGVMSSNCDVIIIFRFLVDSEQSGGRILDGQPVKVILSLTFYLTKTEKLTKLFM